MTVHVRLVSLSSSADELARAMADQEHMPHEIFCSLVLEIAIRERHALNEQFAAAAAKVGRGA